MALLDLTNYWSDSWRRYNLKRVYCFLHGNVASSFGLGESSGKPCEEVYQGWRELPVRRKNVWCLAIVTKLKALERVNR